ncbi:MAG: PEP/pyruvate-binding domain-containing protein [Syntrophobacteraceae bacterium]
MLDEPLIVSFEEGDPANVGLLGAKGARLAEDYRNLREVFPGMEDKISVPAGFILTTGAWRLFDAAGGRLPEDIFASALSELISLEQRTARKFGDTSGRMPLFVAVRGGAPVSLPGALGTVLNVGFNDSVASALIAAGEDEAFVLTTFLTAIRMYGEIVLEIPYEKFYRIIKEAGDEGNISVPALRQLITQFKQVLDGAVHPRFPSGFEGRLDRQLRNCIEAVFASWMAPVAVEARQSRHGPATVPEDMGTAVVVQQMVFGNRDGECLSGVLFTREQRTGANYPIVEWAPKVQCDKIVSGKLRKKLLQAADLRGFSPEIYARLLLVRNALETRARRPLDMEFTVENGRLFLLQRRPMRMTSSATVRAMWDFIDEGKTTIQLASMVINQALAQPEKVLREDFTDYSVLASGQPITDSADSGAMVFGTEAALELAERGEDVILLRARPYGEIDLAVNHPRVRGIIRVDGHTTGHEAVSAVAYRKPYLINVRDAKGRPLLITKGDEVTLNPESSIYPHMGKRVFVDGERGILGRTDASDFLEDRRVRKKLYVDWEYLREQFESSGYPTATYTELIDFHYEWELELDSCREMECKIAAGLDVPVEELLHTFDTWLRCFRPGDRIKAMRLKEVRADDFDLGPPLTYSGKNLSREVLKIIRTLMLSTTWWTHWIHEILVAKARERGETENDVIRDINLKNRTMSLLREFEKEGFHLMKAPDFSYLIFASNFEYEEDPDRLQIGPGALNYKEKELLARQFMRYLNSVNQPLANRLRIIQGEPPMGQGHARIVSIGLAIPEGDFALVCRYLRVFLDQCRDGCSLDLTSMVPETGFVELYQIDPFFAPYPDFRVTREFYGSDAGGDFFVSFGGCSFGEFEGAIFGKQDYDRLTSRVKEFALHYKKRKLEQVFRPWHFEIDPFRRHSLIAAVGIRFNGKLFSQVLEELKKFLAK